MSRKELSVARELEKMGFIEEATPRDYPDSIRMYVKESDTGVYTVSFFFTNDVINISLFVEKTGFGSFHSGIYNSLSDMKKLINKSSIFFRR